MGSRKVLAAALGVALAAAPSCKSSAFVCLSHAQCQTGGEQAWCEPTGYCSFPAEACPSGRTYGEFSPDGLANMCVPVDAADTGEGDGGTDGATSQGDGPGDADATVADGDNDESDGPADTETSDATEGETDGGTFVCGDALTDDFEDGVVGAQWGVFSTDPSFEAWLSETDGALQVSLPAAADGYVGITSVDLLALDNGRVRLDLVALPGPASYITVAVGAVDPDSPGLILYIYDSVAALAYQADASTIDPLGDNIPLDPSERYFELQFSAQPVDASVALRVSSDGDSFTEVVNVPHDAPLDASVLFYYVTSWDPDAQSGDTVRLSRIEACQG